MPDIVTNVLYQDIDRLQEKVKELEAENHRLIVQRDGAFERWKSAISKYPNGADGCCCLFDDNENQVQWCTPHAELRDENDALTAERDKLKARVAELEAENKRLQKMNPCGHTGFESAPCDICGYPDPRKLIAKLKAENKRLAGELAKWTRKHDDADLQGMKKQADQPSLAAKQAYINALVYYLRHAEAENKRLREALKYIAFTTPGPTMKTHSEAAEQAMKEASDE